MFVYMYKSQLLELFEMVRSLLEASSDLAIILARLNTINNT